MHKPHLSEEDILERLAAHESSTSPNLLADNEVAVDALAFKAMSDELASLKSIQAAKDAAVAEANRYKLQYAAAEKRNLCIPTKVGGYNGIHPSEFDLVVATSAHQLLANIRVIYGESHHPFSQPLVLVPVVLWPHAIQPERRPFLLDATGNPRRDRDTNLPIPNYEIGQTIINESYAESPILIDGISTPISISGMATLNINPYSGTNPTTIRERLDKRAGPRSARPSHPQDAAFIPSAQPTIRESRPISPTSPNHKEDL